MLTIFFKKYFSISKFESRSMCASTSFIISMQIIIYWQNFKLKKSTPSVFSTFWCDIKLKRILRLSLEVKVFDNLINYNLLTASHKKNQLRLLFQLPDMIWSWDLHWKYPLGSEGDWLSHQFDLVVFSGNCFWSVNYTSVTWINWWCCISSPFVKGYHWPKFQFHTMCGSWDTFLEKNSYFYFHY